MKVLVTGGSGYVGSKLIPALLDNDCLVSSLDVVKYGGVREDNLILTHGDIRDTAKVGAAMLACDAVIHLACLSNDPASDLDSDLTKSINYDSFLPLVKAAKDACVKRFILASSSSVYGVKNEHNVTEDLPLKPMTDYSKYKAMCEEVLLNEREPGFETVIVRPATICGFAPALRLDLCVHILTMAALRRGEITVFGGGQYRPNIHIDDIVDAYFTLLLAPASKVDGQVFNVGYRNLTIQETAEMVRSICGGEIVNKPLLNDPRSYHVSSEKYDNMFRVVPCHSIEDAIRSLRTAYLEGDIPDPDNNRYYRVKQMKDVFIDG